VIDYYRWIGLPHRLGADPSNGEGADCLILVHKILTSAGVSCPPINKRWFLLVAKKDWAKMHEIWNCHMVQVDKPKNFDVYMATNNVTGLCLGAVVDDGIVTVHHEKGVCWVPLSLTKGPFWRLRDAAL
jgi:hypothetical protein